MALSEWESLRKAAPDPERKSNMSAVPTYPNLVRPLKPASRSRQLQQPKVNSNNQKKCNNLTHLLTLRSNGTKAGCTTTCKECGQEISWETLNRDGRSRWCLSVALTDFFGSFCKCWRPGSSIHCVYESIRVESRNDNEIGPCGPHGRTHEMQLNQSHCYGI